MTDFLEFAIQGIPVGCVFALMAIGIVLVYKTAGVLNLAFAAQAFTSAAVYFQVRKEWEWSNVPAFVLAVVIVAPAIGYLLDRFLFRYLRTAPPIARLVTSLGLLVAIPEIVKVLFFSPDAYFGPGATFNNFGPPTIAPDPDRLYRIGSFTLDGNQVTTIAITVVVVVGLTVLFRFTQVGLRMRAVVESPRLTQLQGINADRIGSFAWMLSSFIAGLAGVLLAPLFAQVTSQNYTTLLVAALAVAVFGGLTNIPLTFLGGLLLGMLQSVLSGYLPLDSVLATGLRPALPFFALFALLLFWPLLRRQREVSDPLAGVDPPPPALAAEERTRTQTLLVRGFGVVATLTFLVVSLAVLDEFWLLLMTKAVIFATIFLSITVITGMAGQVSLCQATFAAIGAFTTGQLVLHYDMSVLLTVVFGAVIAGAVGALLAIPALRLGGIYLSLATLAFALAFESVLVPLDWVGGGTTLLRVPRPQIGSIDFADGEPFFLLCCVVLAIVTAVVVLARLGTTGRFLDAIRGSEQAATSIGINPARSKIVAFTFSAAIAGVGGSLLAMQEQQANATSFVPFIGLFWVVIVVTLGARTVEGAITAGFAVILVAEILSRLGLPGGFQYVLFGLGALTYARHPEGIVEFNKRAILGRFRRVGGDDETEATAAGAVTEEEEVVGAEP